MISNERQTTAIAAILSPTLVTTLTLIFGGCCSNVYTLEAILSLSPATGHLVTFLQFILISLFKLPSQLRAFNALTESRSGNKSEALGLKDRKIPLKKWIAFSALFVTINILNNAAFNYKISLPLHIILRSAGPVTSMILGYAIAGKRYSPRKILAVVLLFIGVVLAALSDASSRAEQPILASASGGLPMKSALTEQIPGFVLVSTALVISAFMGIYSDNLYATYGRTHDIVEEQLFYSHTLSLPFFALQHRTLKGQYTTLMANANANATSDMNAASVPYLDSVAHILPLSAIKLLLSTSSVPLLLLGANAITQILCITGVHRLSTQTSSLTVSIILNIRKLVSLLLSIWLFGNRLPLGVAIGAAIVFVGGGLYGIPEKKPRTNKNDDKKSSAGPPRIVKSDAILVKSEDQKSPVTKSS